MSVTVNLDVNISMGTSVTETSEGTVTEADAYTMDLAFALSADGGDGGGGDGMSLLAGGDAIAIGEHTLATADVTAVVSDGGSSTEGYATASFNAVAVSGEDDVAFASAIAFAEVSGDADRSFTMSYTTTGTSVEDGTTVTSASALSTAYALDVDLSGSGGGTAGGAGMQFEPEPPPPETFDPLPLDGSYDCWDDGDPYAALDGNVAYFNVEAAAYGDNTTLQVDAFAIAIEDQLSNVTVVVVAAVD